MKHVVMFSGGSSSWAAGKLVANRYGTSDLTLLFADTLMEDEDLYRFLDESAANIGVEVVRMCDGRDPWQVFFDERFLGNSRVDPCSKILKRQNLERWMRDNCDPETTTRYLGFDGTEMHRLERHRKAVSPWTVVAPLMEWGCPRGLSVEEWMKEEGLKPPRLYDLGFSHNNCFGGETRFLSDGGMRSLSDACGETLMVLGEGGHWREAEIRHFGRQNIYVLSAIRYGDTKTIRTTGDHQWYVRRGRTRRDPRITKKLLPGDKLFSRPAEWEVVGVEDTGNDDDVFCAVVPDGHVFTLEDNILTGNCGGFCIKSGQSQFKLLLETMPDRYAYHERREQELREYLGKDVSILRDRRQGHEGPLTLKAFRERLQSGDCRLQFFGNESCSCMVSEDEQVLPSIPT